MIADISLIVTALGVLGAWSSLRQSYRERLRQFETKYVERYWKIIDQLTLEALQATRTSAFPGEVNVNPQDERAIRSYIILCEDELEQRANGYITDVTYHEWRDGILQQFDNNPTFLKVWEVTRGQMTHPYEHLEQLLEKNRVYEPLKMSRFKKVLRGLTGIGGILRAISPVQVLPVESG